MYNILRKFARCFAFDQKISYSNHINKAMTDELNVVFLFQRTIALERWDFITWLIFEFILNFPFYWNEIFISLNRTFVEYFISIQQLIRHIIIFNLTTSQFWYCFSSVLDHFSKDETFWQSFSRPLKDNTFSRQLKWKRLFLTWNIRRIHR